MRAQRIHAFLAGGVRRRARAPDRAEPHAAVRAALEAKLARSRGCGERLSGLLAEMDHVVATLQTVQAEILAADDLEQAALDEGTLAGQISELRAGVAAVSAGLEEGFAETRARQV